MRRERAHGPAFSAVSSTRGGCGGGSGLCTRNGGDSVRGDGDRSPDDVNVADCALSRIAQ